jgi:chromosome condensin MukBEF ATPase and DNA-binding subunit MukB
MFEDLTNYNEILDSINKTNQHVVVAVNPHVVLSEGQVGMIDQYTIKDLKFHRQSFNVLLEFLAHHRKTFGITEM